MQLALQLLVTTILIVIATLIYGTGVVITTKLFNHEARNLRQQRLARREFGLMVPMALFLFGLHTIEIALFAAFYWLTGEPGSIERALHVSALAYTTMGAVEGAVPRWPLVVAFEGLAGFLLIGWSAAVFVTDMEKVLRRRE